MTVVDRSLEAVRRYYGEVLRSNRDLQTSACCLDEKVPQFISDVLGEVHPEVKDRFYGCGSPLPPALEGLTVLDLGCGSGRDCYILSKLVGPSGRVIGVDMTERQLEVARRHLDYHAKKFAHANVAFHLGFMEELGSVGIATSSVDLVVSNCVINLSRDKLAVFNEVFRVLKAGGECYFSDVFSDRRVPTSLAEDPVLLGECLGGALYQEDFRRLLCEAGCRDARVVTSRRLSIDNPEIDRKVGLIQFRSATIRAFKLDLEDRCEDFGQVASYKGTLLEHPHCFDLDDHHRFEVGKPMLVCGNTADMLTRTRYAPHFQVTGDKSVHHGLFECASPAAAQAGDATARGTCC